MLLAAEWARQQQLRPQPAAEPMFRQQPQQPPNQQRPPPPPPQLTPRSQALLPDGPPAPPLRAAPAVAAPAVAAPVKPPPPVLVATPAVPVAVPAAVLLKAPPVAVPAVAAPDTPPPPARLLAAQGVPVAVPAAVPIKAPPPAAPAADRADAQQIQGGIGAAGAGWSGRTRSTDDQPAAPLASPDQADEGLLWSWWWSDSYQAWMWSPQVLRSDDRGQWAWARDGERRYAVYFFPRQ